MSDTFNDYHFSALDWGNAIVSGDTATISGHAGIDATLTGSVSQPGDSLIFSNGDETLPATATDLDNATSIVLMINGSDYYFSTAAVTENEVVTYTNTTLGEFDPTPAALAPVLAPGSDSGTPGDDITDNTTPLIEGTVSGTAGAVTLFDGATEVGTGSVGADGSWNIRSSALAVGAHVLTATYTDAGGNASFPSSPLDLAIVAAPAAPSAPMLQISPTDIVGGTAVTEETAPEITGTADAFTTVTLYDGTTLVGSTTSGPTGSWTITTTPLALGAHVLTAIDTQSDTTGDVSAASPPLDLTIAPKSALMAVTVTTSTGGTTLATGDVADFHFTYNQPVSIGVAQGSPAPALQLNDGGLATYDAALSSPTELVFAYTVTFGDSTADLEVVGVNFSGKAITDANGFVPTTSPDGEDVLGAATGISVATTPLTIQLADDSGSSSTDGLTNDAALKGTGTPNGTVTLSENSHMLATAIVAANGSWLAPASVLGLADGAHQIVASENGLPETTIVFTLDTTAPAIVLRATTVANVPTPVLAGTGEAGAAVALTLDGQALGTTTAGTDGSWSFAVGSTIAPGTHTVTAQATDAAGNASTIASGKLVELAAPVVGISVLDDVSVTLPQLLAGDGSLQLTPGTEQVQLADGVVSTGPDTPQAFLARLYEGLFGRAPDTPGLSGWNAQLDAGASDTSVAQGFLGSQEGEAATSGLSDQKFVADLYQGLLRRAATVAETDLWTGDLAGGASRAQVLSFIAGSTESRTALASTTTAVWAPNPDAILVEATYATAFGRAPDLSGEQVWTNALAHGLSLADFEAAIAASPEFQSLHAGQSPSALATSFYENGLGRAPSAAELANAAGTLRSGAGVAGLLTSVALSPEANAHVGAVLV